jgi:hypothetical protein
LLRIATNPERSRRSSRLEYWARHHIPGPRFE